MRLLTKNKGLIAVAIVVVLAIVVFSARRQKSSASQYFTAAVEQGPLRNVVNATGVVQTVVTVQVGSQVSGKISKLFADFNSVVTQGQILAQIDQQRPDQTRATGYVGEHVHHRRPPPQLQHQVLCVVRCCQPPAMLPRKRQDRQAILHPFQHLRYLPVAPAPLISHLLPTPQALRQRLATQDCLDILLHLPVVPGPHLLRELPLEMHLATLPADPLEVTLQGTADPPWASLVTSSTPCKPRSFSSRNRSPHVTSFSLSATRQSRISRQPWAFTPNTTSTACDTTLPSIRTCS